MLKNVASYQENDQIGKAKTAIALVPQPPLPDGPYRLVVADPPWAFSLRESDSTHRGRCSYPSMQQGAIEALEVEKMCHDQAYLLLWFTKQHTEQAYAVARAWGFTPKTFHTWRKVSKAGTTRMMIGHYGRNAEEHYLVATRGKVGSWTGLGLTNIPSLFSAPVGPPSQKPEEFWDIANRLQGAIAGKWGDCPSIELFSRSPRPGWFSWGKEASSLSKP